ncbi:hypothetical protein, partial [Arthrobacter sp. ISL-72]|uniref:hypothetical protein n=1 Tax=Arthrobacter sp. ISL-72 TaxID=2819114 RepID=UPI001BEB2538
MKFLPAILKSKTSRRDHSTKRAGAGALTALLLVAASLMFSAPAQAAGPVTVKGEITCINNASPVGVWVQAQSSTSGWAKTKVPIKLGGHSKVAYEFKLDRGGRYKVSVGCGGNSKKWGKTLTSDLLTGTTNNLVGPRLA